MENQFFFQSNNIVFYDSECFLCDKFFRFLIKYEKNDKLFFSPIKSDFAISVFSQLNFDYKELDSIIFLEEKKIFSRAKAISRISRNLKLPFSLLYYLIEITPRFIANATYNFIAKHRYKLFGKLKSCSINHIQDVKDRILLTSECNHSAPTPSNPSK